MRRHMRSLSSSHLIPQCSNNALHPLLSLLCLFHFLSPPSLLPTPHHHQSPNITHHQNDDEEVEYRCTRALIPCVLDELKCAVRTLFSHAIGSSESVVRTLEGALISLMFAFFDGLVV